MTVSIKHISIVIRRDAIEQKYTGGWTKWLYDRKQQPKPAVYSGKFLRDEWYDEHLFRTGIADGRTETMVNEFEQLGFTGLVSNDNGNSYWQDFCEIWGVEPEEGICEWLVFDKKNWQVAFRGFESSPEIFVHEDYPNYARKWAIDVAATRLPQLCEAETKASETGIIHLEGNFIRHGDGDVFFSKGDYWLHIFSTEWKNNTGSIFDSVRHIETFRVCVGDKLLVQDGDWVHAGQTLIVHDPYTTSIFSDAEGKASFTDIIEGETLKTISDEATGITSREIVEADLLKDLYPRISIVDENGEQIRLENGLPAEYRLPIGTLLADVDDQSYVKQGDILARIPRL